MSRTARWVGSTVAATVLFGAAAPAAGSAQSVAPVAPDPFEAIFDGAEAARLSRLAAGHVAERRHEGFVLGGFGLASVLAGAAAAGVGHDDPLWLAAGLTTIGWGVVNALLSLVMLDLSGNATTSADRVRELRGRALFDRRAELVRAQRTSAAIFALNLGLDVFYIAGGILLAVLGATQDPEEPAMQGAGGASAVQGLALLGFDLAEWIRSGRRAGELESGP